MIHAVTITFNAMSDGLLTQFLESVVAQRGVEMRLIVIDNASSDGTADWLDKHLDDSAVLVRNRENRGFAAACNQAIAIARNEGASHLLFLNNDIEFESDAVSRLRERLKKTQASAISPAIVYASPPHKVWFADGIWTRLRGFINYHRGIGTGLSSFEPGCHRTRFAPACFLLVETALFERIGEFDEDYFVYWEDADLCERMYNCEEPIMVDRDIVIRHHVSASTGGWASPFSLREYNRNHMIFLRKHRGWPNIVAALLIVVTKGFLNLIRGVIDSGRFRLQLESLYNGLTRPIRKIL